MTLHTRSVTHESQKEKSRPKNKYDGMLGLSISNLQVQSVNNLLSQLVERFNLVP